MRRLPEMAVRATEAALYFGPNATTAGLADAVGTLEATLAEFSTYLSSRGRKAPRLGALHDPGRRTYRRTTCLFEETQMEMIGVDQAAVLVAEARREVTNGQAIAESWCCV